MIESLRIINLNEKNSVPERKIFILDILTKIVQMSMEIKYLTILLIYCCKVKNTAYHYDAFNYSFISLYV